MKEVKHYCDRCLKPIKERPLFPWEHRYFTKYFNVTPETDRFITEVEMKANEAARNEVNTSSQIIKVDYETWFRQDTKEFELCPSCYHKLKKFLGGKEYKESHDIEW